MLKDITLGQFFPGKTVIHRLDPRTKLLMTVLYLVALFVANSWVSYGLVLAFLITAVSLSRIRPKTLLRGMKPIVIIVVLTAVLNLFYTGGDHVLARFWGITITWEGVRTACPPLSFSAPKRLPSHCIGLAMRPLQTKYRIRFAVYTPKRCTMLGWNRRIYQFMTV